MPILSPHFDPNSRLACERISAEKTSGTNKRALVALAAGAAARRRSHRRGTKRKALAGFRQAIEFLPRNRGQQADKNWIRPSRVAGLRDPAVADPAALARAAGVDPTKLRFEWKDYLALDDESVLRRPRPRAFSKCLSPARRSERRGRRRDAAPLRERSV